MKPIVTVERKKNPTPIQVLYTPTLCITAVNSMYVLPHPHDSHKWTELHCSRYTVWKTSRHHSKDQQEQTNMTAKYSPNIYREEQKHVYTLQHEKCTPVFWWSHDHFNDGTNTDIFRRNNTRPCCRNSIRVLKKDYRLLKVCIHFLCSVLIFHPALNKHLLMFHKCLYNSSNNVLKLQLCDQPILSHG